VENGFPRPHQFQIKKKNILSLRGKNMKGLKDAHHLFWRGYNSSVSGETSVGRGRDIFGILEKAKQRLWETSEGGGGHLRCRPALVSLVEKSAGGGEN